MLDILKLLACNMYSLQDWLQKKKERTRENLQLRKKEEMLREQKKRVTDPFCKL